MRFSLSAIFALFVALALAFLAMRWFGWAGSAAVAGSTLATCGILALGGSSNRRPMAGVVIMLVGLLCGGLAAEMSMQEDMRAPVLAVGIVLAGAIWLWHLFVSWSAPGALHPAEQVSAYGAVVGQLLLASPLALIPAALILYALDVHYRSGWLVLIGIASVPAAICLFMTVIYGLAWLMGKLMMRRRTTPTDLE